MKRPWGPRFFKFLLFAVVGIIVFTGIVMFLWNRLVPPIFGWHEITYMQALGLLVLSRILFGWGRFGGGSWRGMQWRRRMWERWDQMTPEEREQFRATMGRRCGPFEQKPGSTQPV